MAKVTADFSEIIGAVKPMHSVNNGPVVPQAHGFGNLDYYRDARFPFARTHDAAFSPAYGGSHTVDIIAVFPDFEADVSDPASYDFGLTDEYIENIMKAGTKVFYRLGNKIEHESKRYGSLPPKDYFKWAQICEHIIMHMNCGWADGHHYGVEYWEIWNEPDVNPQCWDGPPEDFFPLFDITARHLKKRFPSLKIGGPAFCSINSWLPKPFFDYMTRDPEDPTPIDFISFHRYGTDPSGYAADSFRAREIADSYGYKSAELILNEWNYVKNWNRDDLLSSYYTITGLAGSSFVACSMIEAQHSPLDHLMYYDASPYVKWNGLFDSFTQKPLKSYYPMNAFADLYDLGSEAETASDDKNVRVCAAVSEDGNDAAIMLSYYGGDDAAENIPLDLRLSGLPAGSSFDAEYYILDKDRDMALYALGNFKGESGEYTARLQLYSTLYIRLRKKN